MDDGVTFTSCAFKTTAIFICACSYEYFNERSFMQNARSGCDTAMTRSQHHSQRAWSWHISSHRAELRLKLVHACVHGETPVATNAALTQQIPRSEVVVLRIPRSGLVRKG
jgi:hypothetical protein